MVKYERPFVYVGMSCGRWFLEIGGVVVAMETDPCRDMSTSGNQWEKANIEDAAKRIHQNLLDRIGQDKELFK